jgi:hypothetical protein
MSRHRGGHKVGKGTYGNSSTGERVVDMLPAMGILIMGPAIGLIYAAFLPFIGIAMVFKVVAHKVAGMALAPIRSGASFGWRPSESYLVGTKKKGSGSVEEAERQNEKTE